MAHASPGTIPWEVLEAAERARALPLAERMAAVSEPMLGAPYRSDPLGEGTGRDPDPPARYEVWDCLTFVEEVLALALAGDPAHAAAVRRDLRYGGHPAEYRYRHHFMELQWLPQAATRGWLTEITRDLGAAVQMRREVHAGTWRGWRRRALFALTDEELPVGEMRLDVLPPEVALAHLAEIPAGALVLTVRSDRPGVPMWTTHLGFTLPKVPPTVRHATKMTPGVVRDHDLSWYIRHIEGYPNWPVAGISVWLPREQGPSLRGLPPERRQEHGQILSSTSSPIRDP